jgi:peroxiredoxin
MKKNILVIVFWLLAIGGFAQLPKVTLKDIHGKEVRTDTLSNQGKPFIIDFFATWCKPCNRELDAISEVYEEWQKETGVKIYAVSIDQAQNIHKVKPLVESHGWEYEVLLDPNGEFKRAMGVQLIPYVLIVDGNGNIVYRHQGYADGEEEELRKTLLNIR